MEDKIYCSSSFLMYRYVANNLYSFNERPLLENEEDFKYTKIKNSDELDIYVRDKIGQLVKNRKVALALSGGIDSAIIAKLLPEGTTAYTFRCLLDNGKEADISETKQAAKYAEICKLNHKIIDVTWDDMEKYSTILMKQKNQPIHSIEVQIYKAALQAKKDGFDTLIFGETADTSYGGLDKLLSREWTFGEFVDRYAYVLPYKVLKEYVLDLEPIRKYCKSDGYVDAHEFLRREVTRGDYIEFYNPCKLAGIDYVGAYHKTWLDVPLDIKRIRNGEPKYIIAELFKKYYGDMEMPYKIPMPRPTYEWLKDWKGPMRPEFWPNCTDNMTGDQRWMVYILEKFLNMLDEGE